MVIDNVIPYPFKNQNTMPIRYYLLLFLFISLLLSGCNKNPEDEQSSVVSSETAKPSQASVIEAVVPNKTVHLRAESRSFIIVEPVSTQQPTEQIRAPNLIGLNAPATLGHRRRLSTICLGV
jgi:hypothetical protein